MTSHRILQLNAASTAVCAIGMLAARETLPAMFGLATPAPLDALAVGFLGYAGALVAAAHRRPVSRQTLIAFTVADALWVAASALLLLLFWAQLAPLARAIVIGAAAVVEVFAALQFHAAAKIANRTPQIA